MSLKIYDADQVTLSFGPILIESGFAEGEFLRIEQTTEDFISVVGTDGEVTRSKTKDGRATITILLMQSSDSNAALSALNNLDKSTPNGAGVVPMLVKDRQGTSLYTAQNCWVMKAPDIAFDQVATAREWQLECADLVRFDGGN